MTARWYNEGRYEQECAAFDADHPVLAREVWESLQRPSGELARDIVLPADSLLLRSQDDPWEDFARRVYVDGLRPVAYPQIPRVL